MNWGKLREVAEHENVRMFELKVSQGAKAGKGGMLMGAKVGSEIAALRGIKIGEDSISPNRHNECSDVESLLDFVAEMRKVTGKPCGIKMALGNEEELDALFKAASVKVDGGLDFVTIDGGEGGTGAAPASLMDYVGLPLMSALPIVARLKKKHKLNHMEIIASGKLVTPDKVCEAMALGADYCVSARGFMFALGCIQAMQCEKNTCPTGITTHNPKLTKGLDVSDKSERVASYVKNVEYEVGVIAHSCGLKSPRDFAPKHLFALGGE